METIALDLAAFFQVLLIDLALGADNALAVGLALSGLEDERRRRAALFWGLVLALFLRIALGTLAISALALPGVLLIGGMLALFAAWRLREPRMAYRVREAPQGFAPALIAVALADTSLEGVIATAAVSRHSAFILGFALVISTLLTAIAAPLIARAVARHRWLSWLALICVAFGGMVMLWTGAHDLAPGLTPPPF